MTGVSEKALTLARIAAALQSETPWRDVPALWFLTDEARTPDPAAIAERLPEGTAVLLRHYRSPDRAALAETLVEIARRRGLALFVGADEKLARAAGAKGLHLPRWAPAGNPPTDLIVSASVHDLGELRARQAVASVLLVSPAFTTTSHEGAPPLGIAGLAEFVAAASKPVIALGGITAANAESLRGTGVAGIAAIGAFSAD